MIELLKHFVEQYGYLAVGLLVALEGLGIPLPGETAVVTAAAFAATGSLNIFGVIAAATAGAIVGGSGGYWIGQRGGRGLLKRYGRFIRISPERLARTEQYFNRHGVKTVLLARFVALLRIFGPILAGIAHMPFPLFTLVNLLGGLFWASTFGALGYVFGRNLDLLDDYIGEFSIALSVVMVIAIAIVWHRRRRGASSSR